MKAIIFALLMAITGCTAEAPIEQPDAGIVEPTPDAAPTGKASCLATVAGPYHTEPADTGPCWMQVTIQTRCQVGVRQEEARRIEVFWYAEQPTYGGGYLHTTYRCGELMVATFYNTLCTGAPIIGGAWFEDPLTPGPINHDTAPACTENSVIQPISFRPAPDALPGFMARDVRDRK